MKHNLIFIFIFLPVMTVFGQTFNVQVGPSFSKSNWENIGSSDHNSLLEDKVVGISGSLGAEYWNKKYFNLSSNIGFVQKGGKDSIWTVFGPPDPLPLFPYKLKLNYLTVNTLIVARIPVKDAIFPYIFVGPRVDYLVSYSEDSPGIIQGYADRDKVNYLNYGFITGVGIKYKFDKFLLGVVYNYNINLNNLVDFKWTSSGSTYKISDNTYTLNLQIGYKL